MKESVRQEVNMIYRRYGSALSLKYKNARLSIDDFKLKANWGWICKWQTLSEDFIRFFQDYMYWKYISKYQILSDGFIMEFIYTLDSDLILIYQDISKELRMKIRSGNVIFPEEIKRIKNRFEILDL